MRMAMDESLPDTLPANPLVVAAEWLAEAWTRGDNPNPNAMVLATSEEGRPSARVVLCKEIEPTPGLLRFVSNYHSRKGRELDHNPRAAVVLHWDHQHRQVRVEGIVQRSSPTDSDQYFASRQRASQLGAHASHQSEPIASKSALRAKLDAVITRFGSDAAVPVPRPPHWGGYILWADTVELWTEGTSRLHDRARWTRELALNLDGPRRMGSWTATRLQP
jgi:pyridoxamine 5'-phosphate oxidase